MKDFSNSTAWQTWRRGSIIYSNLAFNFQMGKNHKGSFVEGTPWCAGFLTVNGDPIIIRKDIEVWELRWPILSSQTPPIFAVPKHVEHYTECWGVWTRSYRGMFELDLTGCNRLVLLLTSLERDILGSSEGITEQEASQIQKCNNFHELLDYIK